MGASRPRWWLLPLVLNFSISSASPVQPLNSDRSAESEQTCLSWDKDCTWASRSMDEPVVALQLSKAVRKRGKPAATSAEQILAEGATNEKDKVSPPAKALGSPELKVVQAHSYVLSNQMPQAQRLSHLAEEDAETSFFQTEANLAKAALPWQGVSSSGGSMVTAISEVAKDPFKWSRGAKPQPVHAFFAVSSVVLFGVWYMLTWGGWRRYVRKLYFKICGRRGKLASLPAAEATTPVELEFRKSSLTEAAASFAIPLIPFQYSIVEHMNFDITERDRGVVLKAGLTRLPGRDEWEKIEIGKMSEPSTDYVSPNSAPAQMNACLSCCRMESQPDIDSQNAVQDAVDSWLSLLVHEKNSDTPEVTGSEDSDNEQALSSPEKTHAKGSEQSETSSPGYYKRGTRPATQKTKDKPDTSKSKKKSRPRLEVRDSQGNNLGSFEPGPTGQYVFQHSVEAVKMEIDTCIENSVVVCQDGRAIAVATGVKWDGSALLVGDEQADFLQVDTVKCPEDPDIMQVLLCVLAPITFKR